MAYRYSELIALLEKDRRLFACTDASRCTRQNHCPFRQGAALFTVSGFQHRNARTYQGEVLDDLRDCEDHV